MGMYVMQNAEVIATMIERYKIKVDPVWLVIDRKARTMTDESSGDVWNIPENWNLS